ncbi:hypothetical protein ACFS07_04040 [Undibacterium arcticum]
MSVVCGIYGFQVTRQIDLPGLCIKPRTNDYAQAKGWARDLDVYHLTAVLTADSVTNTYLFNLEAVLSFVERLDVIITSPSDQSDDDPFVQLPDTIHAHRRNNGGGAVIGEDTFFRASRALFIAKAIERLEDQAFCESTRFKTLFFSSVSSPSVSASRSSRFPTFSCSPA